MPRALAPERQAEYDRDKGFTLHLAAAVDELAQREGPTLVGTPGPDGKIVYREVSHPPINMAAALTARLERDEAAAPARTHIGLCQARNDLLEISRRFSHEIVESIDAEFRRLNLPTLTAMRASVWQTIPKVLKRGRIRTETEYYVVIERVNDVSETDGLPPDDRIQLAKLADEFEIRAVKRRGGAA